MSTVREILAVKGTDVHTISESASVLDAVKKMNEHSIGCLVATREDGTVSGVVAERDVLRKVVAAKEDLAAVPTSQIMSQQVIVCSPADSLDTARSIMKSHFVRHIPVVGNKGELQGLVSIGDVNAYLAEEEEVEINYLHDYIEGRVR